MTARWTQNTIMKHKAWNLQWRGGHVTARCVDLCIASLTGSVLQWRGGHVTARCSNESA